jgi:hypothetical protein
MNDLQLENLDEMCTDGDTAMFGVMVSIYVRSQSTDCFRFNGALRHSSPSTGFENTV